jgi:hypothetical protein
MICKVAITLTLALLLAAGPSSGVVREPASDETRAGMCGEFSGLAFGFCVALCEARECDLQSTDDERCAVLRRGFDRATGGLEPPC